MKRKKMITERRLTAGLLVIFLMVAASSPMARADSKSHARDPYALLFGTIFGPNDRPLYGVKVKIRRADQKRPKWELVSNHEGEFAQRVPAGKADYIVSVDAKTPKGQPKPELTVHVDNDERKDFVLHLK
jgi:hypothetical protein